MRVKNTFFTILSFVFLFGLVGTVSAQVQLSEKTAEKLDDAQVARMWSQVDHSASLAKSWLAPMKSNLASVTVPQAQAMIEVTVSGQNVSANFLTLTSSPIGTMFAFRMTLPNGTIVPLEGFSIQYAGTVYIGFSNGPFPDIWPSGFTLLEALIINSTNGQVSYVSAYAPVRTCCAVTGPLQRAEVAADGNSINLSGSFQGDVIATLNGQLFPVVTSFSPITGGATSRIDVSGAYGGQQTLTVCSGGSCSSRVIYIIRQSQ